jgi:hypothetical protein
MIVDSLATHLDIKKDHFISFWDLFSGIKVKTKKPLSFLSRA